jgi:hypothetical protein
MQVSRDILNYIADSIEANEKCFLHKKTLEVVTVPEDFLFYEGLNRKIWKEEFNKIKSDKKNYIRIEKMNSTQYFSIIEEFINSLENRQVKIRLLRTIDGRKPIANFKHQIENAGFERELWFAFRREKNIHWVQDQLNSVSV